MFTPVLVLLLSGSVAHPCAAQRTDSTRVGVKALTPVRTIVRPDSVTGPPISARRAFIYSALLPGYGQARLGRANSAIVYALVEVGSLGMARKAAQDLREARAAPKDSIVTGYVVDPQTGAAVLDLTTGLPRPTGYTHSRFTSDRIKARRTHYEDWIAALIFNHLISGADAYVAANLWDFRANIAVDPTTKATTIGGQLTF